MLSVSVTGFESRAGHVAKKVRIMMRQPKPYYLFSIMNCSKICQPRHLLSIEAILDSSF